MKLYLRGGVFWVYETIGGRTIRKSTGCTDEAEARDVAEKMLAVSHIRNAGDRVAAAAGMMSSLNDRADAMEAAGKATPLDSVWRRHPYRGAGRRSIKQSSIDSARLAWNLFVKYCQSCGCGTLEAVTPEMADGWLATLGRRRYATVAYQYCRAICISAGFEGGRCPFQHAPKIPKDKARHQPLTMEQVGMLFRKCDSLASRIGHAGDAAEFAVFVRFLVYTGLRLGDAATAKVADVDFNVEPPMLSRIAAKTGEPIRFPIHPSIAPLLNREGGYLFPQMQSLYSRGTALTLRIKRLFAMIGISGKAYEYSAHSLRTTFATICAANGVPMAAIQSWLGHTSQEVTRIYTNFEADKAKANALRSFPNLE